MVLAYEEALETGEEENERAEVLRPEKTDERSIVDIVVVVVVVVVVKDGEVVYLICVKAKNDTSEKSETKRRNCRKGTYSQKGCTGLAPFTREPRPH